jgi:PAS domain-containing protein
MGQDPHIGLAELWAKFHDIIRDGEKTGQPHVDENQLLPLSRFGYLEEIYYSYRFIPIVGDEGYVVGHYVLPQEATRDILSDRRTLMAQTMAVRLAECKSMREFWPSLLAGFGPSDKDFPMVALYASSQYASEPTSEQSRITCLLEDCLGVSENHVPSRLILPRASRTVGSVSKAIEKLLATLFHKALNSTGPLLVTRDILPDSFLKGVTWRGFGIPSQEYLIIPLRTSKGVVVGFVFAGLNPMKRYHQDSDFADHVKMITQQVAIPRASSILLAEEVRQGEERLTIRSEELKQSEAKYRNFAEHSPVGVALISSDRCIEFANEAW